MSNIKEPFEYSDDFIKETKSIYPNWHELHLAISCGYITSVDVRLKKGAEEMISYVEVLRAFNSDVETRKIRLAELYAHAELIKKKEDLYEEFRGMIATPEEPDQMY